MNRYYRPDYRYSRERSAMTNAMPETDAQRNEDRGCCGSSLAIVYAPRQTFTDYYTPTQALCRGTMFRALDLPFRGGM